MFSIFNLDDKLISTKDKNKYLFTIDKIGIFYWNIYEFRYKTEHKIKLLEDIVNDYKRNGINFVNKLEPNSILILCDYRNDRLILKTDEVGHFIIYYALKNKILFISSELKLLAKKLEANIDKTSLYKYIMWGYIPDETTIFENIKRLLPCHLMLYEKKGIKLRSYYNFLKYKRFRTNSELFYIRKLKMEFKEILKNFKDQKIGIMISSGIDSIFLLRLLKQINKDIKTFCIGNEKINRNVLYNCRILSDYFGTDHREIIIDITTYIKNFFKTLEIIDNLIFDMDLPIIYYSTKKIKNIVDYLFHGFGSDEIFNIPFKIILQKNSNIPFALNAHYNISLYNSIRIIFPYLDYKIIKLITSLSSNLKTRGNIDKYIIRKILSNFLPNNIVCKKRETSSIPDSWRKIIIKTYYEYVRKSIFIRELISKKIINLNKPSFNLKLIIFNFWYYYFNKT